MTLGSFFAVEVQYAVNALLQCARINTIGAQVVRQAGGRDTCAVGNTAALPRQQVHAVNALATRTAFQQLLKNTGDTGHH